MWSETDKFYYDTLNVEGGEPLRLRIQSIVGLTSLFAVSIMSKETLALLPDFSKRIAWYENYRRKNKLFWPNEERSTGESLLVSLVQKERLVHLLKRLLNEDEFLSDGGVKSIIKIP